MVLFSFPSMLRASKREGRPSPPSVEEIISDLQAAKANDVAFKPPEDFRSLSSEKETPKETQVKATGTSREDILPKQTVGRQHEDENQKSSETPVQDAEVYSKAQEFLEHYNSLLESVRKLKGMDDNMKSKEEELTKSIKQVKELWKVEDTEN